MTKFIYTIHVFTAKTGGIQTLVCFCSCCYAVQVSHVISADRRNCAEKRTAVAALSVMWSKIA